MAHPLLALWCHPRTRSTAIERAMMERGDLEVVHEPFSYLYYVHRRRSSVPHLELDPSQPQSYGEVRARLLERAERRPTFFKDMAYHCLEDLLEDEPFVGRMRHAFLIRDPAHSIASHYAIDTDLTLDEVGIEQLCRLYRLVRERTGQNPPVIDSDRFVERPREIFAALCEGLGLARDDGALAWEPGQREEWKSWKEWHREAAESTGIRSRERRYDVRVDNDETLRAYERHHRPYYEELLSFARR